MPPLIIFGWLPGNGCPEGKGGGPFDGGLKLEGGPLAAVGVDAPLCVPCTPPPPGMGRNAIGRITAFPYKINKNVNITFFLTHMLTRCWLSVDKSLL